MLLLTATFASAGTVETTSDGYVKFTDSGGERTDKLLIYQDSGEAIMFESWRIEGDPVDTTAGDCELTASRTEKYAVTYDIDTYSCQVDSSTVGVVALMGDQSDYVFLGNPSNDSLGEDEEFTLYGKECASSAPEDAQCSNIGATTPQLPVHIDLGAGNDRAQIIDQDSNDSVVCGDGEDSVQADRMDIADPSCEEILMYILEVFPGGGTCKENERAVQYFNVFGTPGFVVESGVREMSANTCRDDVIVGQPNYGISVRATIDDKKQISSKGIFTVEISCSSVASKDELARDQGSCVVSPKGAVTVGSRSFFKGVNRKLVKSLRGKNVAKPLFEKVTVKSGAYVDMKFKITNRKLIRHLRAKSKVDRYAVLSTSFDWYNSEDPTVSGSEKSEFVFIKKASKSGKK